MVLNLSNMGLKGYMAPELGNLSYLAELDLSNNNFHGKIPNELRGLHRLKLLNLSYNGFSGDIPPWIGDLSELQHLGLQSNSFGGSVPIEVGQLHQLKTLNIAINELSGRIPVEVFNISSLEVLILAGNWFSGEISKAIGDLPKLKVVDLRLNQLSGMIPREIGNLTNLRELYISQNSMEGEIPISLFNISSIREVQLRNNNLHGSLPQQLCHHLPQLEFFSIPHNNFEGNIPGQIDNCTLLKRLYLDGNSFIEEGQSKTHTNTLATLGYIAPEYGSKGIISTRGDVYSYGILMLEMFTRKKPTDDMFTTELNLKGWVTNLMPHATEIVDSNLLQEEGQQIDDIITYSSTILELALNCCADLPEARINMIDVVASLNKIKMAFMQKTRARTM
ncbi:hypothetical protein L6164_001174 [Bauhinia variegata]|uniref:Uncharacterized protein n=1 Tax=Bauhinia variegata TaxID=167791 RepID=A0ACB9QBG5_BAUVA|nr:hypothetical protein L6164_001174 [Bauhinia variegata]